MAIVTATRNYPYSTVVRVDVVYADGSTASGSGVVVGANDILTASHVVFDGNAGEAVQVVVTPGLSGNSTPFSAYSAVDISYRMVDTDGDGFLSRDFDVPNDLAVISLDRALNVTTGNMALDPNFWASAVNVTGYPGLLGGRTMANEVGSATADGNGVIEFAGGLQAASGMSGGPIWYQTANGAYVVGVVSTTSWGTDLGGPRYNDMAQYVAANDIYMQGGRLPGGRIDASANSDAINGSVNADRIHGLNGDDAIQGGPGSDLVAGGRGNDTVRGGQDADQVAGGVGDDLLYGGNADDLIFGDPGRDQMFGGLGNDTLWGGAGADLLRGGQGNNAYFGDTGADTVELNRATGQDIMSDFNAAEGDRIRLLDGLTLVRIDADSQGDAILRLSNGGALTLWDVKAAAFDRGWLI